MLFKAKPGDAHPDPYPQLRKSAEEYLSVCQDLAVYVQEDKARGTRWKVGGFMEERTIYPWTETSVSVFVHW